MSQYDIYAIGNALVDLEFEVADETLAKLGIDKGVMTLIDFDRQVELLENLAGIKHVKASGGSAANTMIAASRLESKCYYSCKVSDDEFGRFYHEDLIKAGVDTNHEQGINPKGNTGRCIVMLTPDAERSMNTHLGITETFSPKELNVEALKQSKYLYIEGYLVSSGTGREAMHEAKKIAKEAGVLTSISLSDPNIVTYFRQGLKDAIGDGVDLLFCNHKEAMMFCETDDIYKAAEQLKTYAKQFAITLGKKGALLFDGEKSYELPAEDVPVIDTLGAGDTFAGGFLAALTQGKDFETAGKIANLVAAKIITHFGPRLTVEHGEELKARIKENHFSEANC